MASNASEAVWVEVLPSFKDLTKKIDKEFTDVMSDAGDTAGAKTGENFTESFEGSADLAKAGEKLIGALTAEVERGARDASVALRKQSDAISDLRVAEARLDDVRDSGKATRAQLVEAEENVARKARAASAATDDLAQAQRRLDDSNGRLTAGSREVESTLADSGRRSGSSFGSTFFAASGAFLASEAVLSVFRAAGEAIGAAIGGGIRFAITSINVASDLGETRAAIGEVFGPEASKIIEDFASNAGFSLGQTTQEAFSAAQTFGVFGRAAGLADSDLAGFSTDLIALSTDLASFYNTSPEDAIDAIGAGLRGEAEPLRRYGVLLSDVTLRQAAFDAGLIKSTKQALTPQQKVLAAQAAIFKQTTVAQGDFARTSGGLANQQRILAASFENAQVRLGTSLLPAVTQLVTLLNSQLIPVFNEAIDQVGPILSAALVQSIPAIQQLITELAPLLPDLAKLAAESLPLFVQGLILVTPLLIDLTRNMTTVSTSVGNFFKLLNGDISLTQFIGDIQKFSGSWGEASRSIVNFIREAQRNIGNFLSSVGGFGDRFFKSGKDIVDNFIRGVRASFGAVGKTFTDLMKFAAGFFPNSPAQHGPLSGAGWKAIGQSGAAIEKQFESGISGRSSFAPTVSMPALSSVGVGASSLATGSSAPFVQVINKTGVALRDLIDVRIEHAGNLMSIDLETGVA